MDKIRCSALISKNRALQIKFLPHLLLGSIINSSLAVLYWNDISTSSPSTSPIVVLLLLKRKPTDTNNSLLSCFLCSWLADPPLHPPPLSTNSPPKTCTKEVPCSLLPIFPKTIIKLTYSNKNSYYTMLWGF